MKMPVYVERVLYENGPVWWIRDQRYNAIAQNMSEVNARLLAHLLNEDWLAYKSRRGLPDVGDTSEVEFGCVDEE